MNLPVKDKWYTQRVEIAKKAFNQGYVIFSPATQKWYTPRAYVESNEEVTYRDPFGSSEKTPNIVLHHPGNAIQAQSEKAEREQLKLTDLVKAINETFSFQIKNKTH